MGETSFKTQLYSGKKIKFSGHWNDKKSYNSFDFLPDSYVDSGARIIPTPRGNVNINRIHKALFNPPAWYKVFLKSTSLQAGIKKYGFCRFIWIILLGCIVMFYLLTCKTKQSHQDVSRRVLLKTGPRPTARDGLRRPGGPKAHRPAARYGPATRWPNPDFP